MKSLLAFVLIVTSIPAAAQQGAAGQLEDAAAAGGAKTGESYDGGKTASDFIKSGDYVRAEGQWVKKPALAASEVKKADRVSLSIESSSTDDLGAKAKDFATGSGCTGFLSCLGGTVISAVAGPIVIPALGAFAGAAGLGALVGVASGSVALGVLAGIGGGFLGLIAGVIAAPVLTAAAVASGLFSAVVNLFKGNIL